MKSGIGAMVKGAAVKLGIAAALCATAVVVTGLPARTPATAPVAKPVAKAAPAPAPRAATVTAAAAPSAPVEQGYVIKSALQLDQRLDYGDYAWNAEGVPAGPLLITVDLKAQLISVFRDGYEIGVAAILYGADDKPTPLGAFPILEKDADHVSNLYNAPMPHMLRLTNDGVAIHGSDVKWGFGTHGCIGVPPEFAALLFEQASVGDRVIITNGAVLKIGDAVPAA